MFEALRTGPGPALRSGRHNPVSTFAGWVVDAAAVAASRDTQPLAYGIAPTQRRGDYRLAVRIHSRRAVRDPALMSLHARAHGEIDIRYVGPIAAHSARPWYRDECRPVAIGASIAPTRSPPGSVCCFVDKSGAGVRLLSANHVLTASGGKGTEIVQPARKDGGKRGDHAIGTLDEAVPLLADELNEVDCALVEMDPAIGYQADLLGPAMSLSGLAVGFPEENEPVQKIGRTTGLTQGVLTAFELTPQRIRMPAGWRTFDKLIEVNGVGSGAFSRPGDSGSLVFTSKDRAARALVIGGTAIGGGNGEGVTYAAPLSRILEALQASLVT